MFKQARRAAPICKECCKSFCNQGVIQKADSSCLCPMGRYAGLGSFNWLPCERVVGHASLCAYT